MTGSLEGCTLRVQELVRKCLYRRKRCQDLNGKYQITYHDGVKLERQLHAARELGENHDEFLSVSASIKQNQKAQAKAKERLDRANARLNESKDELVREDMPAIHKEYDEIQKGRDRFAFIYYLPGRKYATVYLIGYNCRGDHVPFERRFDYRIGFEKNARMRPINELIHRSRDIEQAVERTRVSEHARELEYDHTHARVHGYEREHERD